MWSWEIVYTSQPSDCTDDPFSYLLRVGNSTVRGLSSLHELNQVSKDRSVIVRARIEASCTETIVMNFLRD